MKTKKLLLAIIIAIFSLSCETPHQERQTEQCDCVIEYYIGAPPVGGGALQYQFQFSNPIDYDCRQETGVYYPVSNINYNYAKVVCE